MAQPKSGEIHEKQVALLRSTKPSMQNENKAEIKTILQEINDTFKAYQLDKETVHRLIKKFIESNLEGPFAERILWVKELVYLLRFLSSN